MKKKNSFKSHLRLERRTLAFSTTKEVDYITRKEKSVIGQTIFEQTPVEPKNKMISRKFKQVHLKAFKVADRTNKIFHVATKTTKF